ncbi:hypothetical protein L916_09000, partial [Phytophthora nicotianae]
SGTWSYISRPNKQVTKQCNNQLFEDFEDGVQQLTVAQRTAEWFILRKFRITGSVAGKVFKAIASSRHEVRDNVAPLTDDADVMTIILILGLISNTANSGDYGEDQHGHHDIVRTPFDCNELARKTGQELKKLCRDLSHQVSGKKQELIDRLLAIANEPVVGDAVWRQQFDENIYTALLSPWFMAPISTTGMKIGTHNEDNISSRIGTFMDKHTCYHIEGLKSYGLLCKKHIPIAAFSPDHIASVVSVNRGRFYAVMEYKTRTTTQTVTKEQSIAAEYGVFSSVNLMTDGFSGAFNAIVPDKDHRLQITHSIACGNIRDGFLVYAAATHIIPVVHVRVEPTVTWTYRSALSATEDNYLAWVYDPAVAVPELNLTRVKHCPDRATLLQSLGLWRALVKLIHDRGDPLPPAKRILPSLIALWNRTKGGIDVYSRYLKNVKPKHFRLSPKATRHFFCLRDLCTSYKAYQKHRQNLPSFGAFIREAAKVLSERPMQSSEPVSVRTELSTTSFSTQTFSYKKRIHFESDSEWKHLRLSKTVQHPLVTFDGGKQRTCILCCQMNHDKENEQQHIRQG